MSVNIDAITAQLRESLPGYGARQGSQTFTELAGRNNQSNSAIRIYAEAAERAKQQQDLFAKVALEQFKAQQKEQARALEFQQEQQRISENIAREANSELTAALNAVGDDRTRQVLSENGTLSGEVAKRLEAKYANLQATGKHIDKEGNLTIQAASLGAALEQSRQNAATVLEQTFGGDQAARDATFAQANEALNASGTSNFIRSSLASGARNLGGLPLQIGAAIAGDNKVGDALGRAAVGVDNFADNIDIVTPEEKAFEQDFANAKGFGGALSTIVNNPGQALQQFGPAVIGALGAGGPTGALIKGGARALAPALTRGVANAAKSNRFVGGTLGAAPAVFAGGGGQFAGQAGATLESDTDNVSDLARRGLAVSAAGSAAAGVAGTFGLSTLDQPLARARQIAAQRAAAPAESFLGKTARGAGTIVSEGARGAVGEGFQESVEGFGGSLSEQRGEGVLLSDLDFARAREEGVKSAAAGAVLGAPVNAVTGSVAKARQKSEEALRQTLNESNGGATTDLPVSTNRDNLSGLDQGQTSATVTAAKDWSLDEMNNYVATVAAELGLAENTSTLKQVQQILPTSLNADGEIDPDLFRARIGEVLGVSLGLNEKGEAAIVSSTEASPLPTEAPTDFDPEIDAVRRGFDALTSAVTPEPLTGPPRIEAPTELDTRIDAVQRGFDALTSALPNEASPEFNAALDTVRRGLDSLETAASPTPAPTTIRNPAEIQGPPIPIESSADAELSRSAPPEIQGPPSPSQIQGPPTPVTDATLRETDADGVGTGDASATDARTGVGTGDALSTGDQSDVGTGGLTPPGGQSDVGTGDTTSTDAQTDVGTGGLTNEEQGVDTTTVTTDQGQGDGTTTDTTPSIDVADLTIGPLADEIEATVGDATNVSEAIRNSDGSPQAQANVDYQTALVRSQLQRGLRQPGDTENAGQLEVRTRLERAADAAGITDAAARTEFFREQRGTAVEQFRAERDAFLSARLEGVPSTPPGEPPSATTTPLSEDTNTTIRTSDELNLITDDNVPGVGLIPESLRPALISSYSAAAEKRSVKGIDAKARRELRARYPQESDLKKPGDLSVVKKLLGEIRTQLDKSYRFTAKDLQQGDGQVPQLKKGTAAARAAAVEKLKVDIPERMAKIQSLMTPEGYQRVFGKKP